MSALSPIPSPSKSDVSLPSCGNTSSSSFTPSPSSSVSAISPIPSPSKSDVSVGSRGNASSTSSTPSPSSSLSAWLSMPSLSVSVSIKADIATGVGLFDPSWISENVEEKAPTGKSDVSNCRAPQRLVLADKFWFVPVHISPGWEVEISDKRIGNEWLFSTHNSVLDNSSSLKNPKFTSGLLTFKLGLLSTETKGSDIGAYELLKFRIAKSLISGVI